MTRRVNVGRADVVPWQVPDLGATTEVGEFRELELAGARSAASPVRDATAGRTISLEEERATAVASATANATADATAEAMRRGHRDGFATGHGEGFAQGFAEGQRQAEQHLADELRLVEAMTRRLAEPARTLERPVEEAIVSLALEVARWVIGTEVSRSPDYLVGLIRDAVAQVPIDVGTPSIVLNPIDIELVRGLAPDFEETGIALIGDESVEPGGCLVVADGAEGAAMKDRRWHPRGHQGVCEVDLTLASRWRNAMLAMFEGEEA